LREKWNNEKLDYTLFTGCRQIAGNSAFFAQGRIQKLRKRNQTIQNKEAGPLNHSPKQKRRRMRIRQTIPALGQRPEILF